MFSMFRSFTAMNRKRRRAATGPGFSVEGLEDRQMLAADLTLANVVLTELSPIPVEGKVNIEATYSVANTGDQGVIANNVVIQMTISTDNIFGNADDLPAGFVTLDLSLFPNTIANGAVAGAATVGNYQAANFLFIQVDPGNEVPEGNNNNNVATLALQGLPQLTMSEGSTLGKFNKAVRVDPNITFGDPDTESFNGGQLRVQVVDDSGELNILSIKKIKTDSGVLRRKQGELRLGKNVIGTISGGTSTQPLVIQFTTDIGGKDIADIASAVSLKGRKGGPLARTVEFQVIEPGIVSGFISSKEVSYVVV